MPEIRLSTPIRVHTRDLEKLIKEGNTFYEMLKVVETGLGAEDFIKEITWFTGLLQQEIDARNTEQALSDG